MDVTGYTTTIKIIKMSDNDIKNMIELFNISDTAKNMIKLLIKMSGETYAGYLHTSFLNYSTTYTPVLCVHTNECKVDSEIDALVNLFKGKKLINNDYLLVGNCYDVLYSKAAITGFNKFASSFYDDCYTVLVKNVDRMEISDHLDEVFQGLELLFGQLEDSISFHILENEQVGNSTFNENFIVYLDKVNTNLYIYIL